MTHSVSETNGVTTFRIRFLESEPNWALNLPSGYEVRSITRVLAQGKYAIVVTGICLVPDKTLFSSSYN